MISGVLAKLSGTCADKEVSMSEQPHIHWLFRARLAHKVKEDKNNEQG